MAGHINRNLESEFHQVHAIVKQVLSSRSSGSPVSSDPFIAFGEILEEIGGANHRSWWNVITMEFKSLNPKVCCGLTVVAAAALCEGALAFFAASPVHGDLTMRDLGPAPKDWSLAKLISAGCTGTAPLLNTKNKLRERLSDLQDMRKVIHPSYYMSADVKGAPALRPEQADRAAETLKQLLRAIIDWVSVNGRARPSR